MFEKMVMQNLTWIWATKEAPLTEIPKSTAVNFNNNNKKVGFFYTAYAIADEMPEKTTSMSQRSSQGKWALERPGKLIQSPYLQVFVAFPALT